MCASVRVRECVYVTDNEERKAAQELVKLTENWNLSHGRRIKWKDMPSKIKTEKTTQKEKEVAKKEKNPPNLNKFVLYFSQCTPCIERDETVHDGLVCAKLKMDTMK